MSIYWYNENIPQRDVQAEFPRDLTVMSFRSPGPGNATLNFRVTSWLHANQTRLNHTDIKLFALGPVSVAVEQWRVPDMQVLALQTMVIPSSMPLRRGINGKLVTMPEYFHRAGAEFDTQAVYRDPLSRAFTVVDRSYINPGARPHGNHVWLNLDGVQGQELVVRARSYSIDWTSILKLDKHGRLILPALTQRESRALTGLCTPYKSVLIL